MNPDDPRLTAYALGELAAEERAEIEQFLREQPEMAAEMEASRQFAEALSMRLKGEHAEPLLDAQRAEVLAFAARETPRVQPLPRQLPSWLTLAAGVAVGIGVALLFPVLNSLKVQPATASARPAGVRDASDVRVSLVDEPASAAEDFVVLNEWPTGGFAPVVSNPIGAMWSWVRVPFSVTDSVLHFDTRLPVIEFSAQPVAQNPAPVSSASRRTISRPSAGAKTLREARYATAPAPMPAPDWDTRAEKGGPAPAAAGSK